MWSPSSAAEVLRAVTDGSLPHESAAFDVKAALPGPKASSDIAIDVAAMATEGGVILYGVAEDKQNVTFAASPIDLAGARDRISDVVTSTVREHLVFEVHLLPLDDDASHGFVVIEVPPSVRAPHMVEVKGQYRYYGRAPGGNVPLTEQRVAQLYERRRSWEVDAGKALDAFVAAAPYEPAPGVRGDMFLLVRPLLADRDLRARTWGTEDQAGLTGIVNTALNALQFETPWQPGLVDLFRNWQSAPTLDGVAVSCSPRGSVGETLIEYASRLEVSDDGTVAFYRAAVACPSPSQPDAYVIRDAAVAQMTAHVGRAAGDLLSRGGYNGPVDVSLAIVGARGAVCADWFGGHRVAPLGAIPALPTDDLRAYERVTVSRLVDDPCGATAALLARLWRVIRVGALPDPLRRRH